MKIAFLITEFPSVAQTFVVEKVESLLQHGHDVSIFTWESKPPSVLHDIYRRIDWPRRSYVLGRIDDWSQSGKVARLLVRALGAFARSPRECVGLIRRVLRTGTPDGRLRRLIHAFPFVGRGLDLIHVQFTWAGHGAEDLGADLGLPMILTVYGADVSLAPGDKNDRLYAVCDRILAPSEFLARFVRDRVHGPETLFVLYNHIDCACSRPVPIPPTPRSTRSRSSSPSPGCTGRRPFKTASTPWPNCGAAASSSAIDSSAKGPTATPWKGPSPTSAWATASSSSAPWSRSQVRDAMRRADVFFLPSVREEFGCVLGEAQACGTPVVATRVGGIPEVVEDGVTGLLAEPRHPTDLADKLAAVLALPDRGRSMGLLGRERVLRLFDRKTVERELIAHYEAVVSLRVAPTATPSRRPPSSGVPEPVGPRV